MIVVFVLAIFDLDIVFVFECFVGNRCASIEPFQRISFSSNRCLPGSFPLGLKTSGPDGKDPVVSGEGYSR